MKEFLIRHVCRRKMPRGECYATTLTRGGKEVLEVSILILLHMRAIYQKSVLLLGIRGSLPDINSEAPLL